MTSKPSVPVNSGTACWEVVYEWPGAVGLMAEDLARPVLEPSLPVGRETDLVERSVAAAVGKSGIDSRIGPVPDRRHGSHAPMSRQDMADLPSAPPYCFGDLAFRNVTGPLERYASGRQAFMESVRSKRPSVSSTN